MTLELHKMSREEVIGTLLEIEPLNEDQFLKIKETLTRMGIANKKKKILFQSCHVLQKKGKYYIVHFKELFALDGREVFMDEEDYNRRNAIGKILENWDLCKIVTKNMKEYYQTNLVILPFKEKQSWNLQPKYKIGKKFN